MENGTVTIQPPEEIGHSGVSYQAWRMRDQLGVHDLRGWQGNRRSLLLPGGTKITMHGNAGEIVRVNLYDGDESHEIHLLTQTLLHSKVDAAEAQWRDAAEADGETGHLVALPEREPGLSLPDMENSRLHLANLYLEPVAEDGTPLSRRPFLEVLGRQVKQDLHFNPPTPEAEAEADQACIADAQPRAGLVRLESGVLQYTSRSGKWVVSIDQHTLTFRHPYGNFKWEVWGDPHENLNGKHIKDWEGDRRSLVLDDGTKITMDAYGPHKVVHTTSIYDGARSHEVGNVGNVVRHSCVNALVTATRDAEEVDGETAFLAQIVGPGIVRGSLYVENVYTEALGPEGAQSPVFEPATLGETGDADTNPNDVVDYYDDPRLGHT